MVEINKIYNEDCLDTMKRMKDNLIYNSKMFTGTEDECKEYIDKNYGNSLAVLLITIRKEGDKNV